MAAEYPEEAARTEADKEGRVSKTVRAGGVPEWSIVRLADGRLGVKAHSLPHRRRGRVLIYLDAEGRCCVELSAEVEVEVVEYAGKIASRRFAELQAGVV